MKHPGPKNKYNPSYKSQSMLGKCVLIDDKKRFVLNHPELLRQFLEIHTKPGDVITMYLTSKRPKRSESQNNYMHLYFALIGESTGHTMKEIKQWAKETILSEGITEIYGDEIRMVKDTSELNIPEMCEFICKVEDITGIPAPITEPFLKPLTHDQYAKLKKAQQIAYKRMKAKIVIPHKNKEKYC